MVGRRLGTIAVAVYGTQGYLASARRRARPKISGATR